MGDKGHEIRRETRGREFDKAMLGGEKKCEGKDRYEIEIAKNFIIGQGGVYRL